MAVIEMLITFVIAVCIVVVLLFLMARCEGAG